MVRHSGAMVLIALAIIGAAVYGMSRVATGFLPIEDQGYLLAAVQLPDGAALGRTQKSLEQVDASPMRSRASSSVITIAGISALDNSSSLANAGVAYIMLKDWSLRGTGQDLASLFKTLNEKLAVIEDGSVLVLPPPPIQGIGNAGGFTMQIELRDGSFDLVKLGNSADAMVRAASTQSSIQRVSTPFRASAPQYKIDDRPREGADAAADHRPGVLDARELSRLELRRPIQQVRPRLPDLRAGGLALPPDPRRHPQPKVRNQNGDMIPLGPF